MKNCVRVRPLIDGASFFRYSRRTSFGTFGKKQGRKVLKERQQLAFTDVNVYVVNPMILFRRQQLHSEVWFEIHFVAAKQLAKPTSPHLLLLRLRRTRTVKQFCDEEARDSLDVTRSCRFLRRLRAQVVRSVPRNPLRIIRHALEKCFFCSPIAEFVWSII